MLKAFASKTPLKPLNSTALSLGGCFFSGTADLNGSSDQVDSAGKEADLARLNGENGSVYREQTIIELFTAWRTFSHDRLSSD